MTLSQRDFGGGLGSDSNVQRDGPEAGGGWIPRRARATAAGPTS